MVAIALSAAFVCFAAGASTALAVPGDGIANATSLNDYVGSSLTTSVIPGQYGTGAYYLRVYLSMGATLHAQFTAGPTLVALQPSVLGYDVYASPQQANPTCALTFKAPATGMYNVWAPASSTGTFTVAPTITAPVYKFSNFSVPSKAKKSKSFSVTVRVNPQYDGASSPVRFTITRWNAKKKAYLGYSSASSKANYIASNYTRYAASMKLPKGLFKITARFSDASHAAFTTSAAKVTVK
jgi:hypothetical protein